MVRTVGVPLHEAIAMASANPARTLRRKTKGRMEAAADADFVVLTPDLEVVQTYLGGRALLC